MITKVTDIYKKIAFLHSTNDLCLIFAFLLKYKYKPTQKILVFEVEVVCDPSHCTQYSYTLRVLSRLCTTYTDIKIHTFYGSIGVRVHLGKW